jgi:predicted transcriptional regulator
VSTPTATEIVKDTTASQTDTTALTGTVSQAVVKADTPQVVKKTELIKPVVYSKDSVLYKFVILATDKKYKALKRYEQLLSYQLRVKMYTKDSTFFKVYFAFPCLAKDTVHIKDSLNLVYGTKVFLER